MTSFPTLVLTDSSGTSPPSARSPGLAAHPGLCACWVATALAGEGSTVMANAERVKVAAEADRSGSLLVDDLDEVATSWRARWHYG
jgi:hypothetical protein